MSYSASSTGKQIDFTKTVPFIALYTARFLYLRNQTYEYIPNKLQLKQAAIGTCPLYHINNTLCTSHGHR